MFNVASMFNVVFDVQHGALRYNVGVFNGDGDGEMKYLHLVHLLLLELT
jgi:hypothetical protein